MLKVSTQNEYFISFAVNAVDGVKMGGGGGGGAPKSNHHFIFGQRDNFKGSK